MKERAMRRWMRPEWMVIVVLWLGGCGVDVVGMATSAAKEKVSALGVTGKTARYAAAEWLDKEAVSKEFYTTTVEPKIEGLYVLGCKGMAKQLREQKPWYEAVADVAIGFLTFWTGTQA